MNIVQMVVEVVRNITLYLMCGIVIVFCYNIICYIFKLDWPAKSIKNLAITFGIIIALVIIDNTIYSIYHVHVINMKVAINPFPLPF